MKPKVFIEMMTEMEDACKTLKSRAELGLFIPKKHGVYTTILDNANVALQELIEMEDDVEGDQYIPECEAGNIGDSEDFDKSPFPNVSDRETEQ